ncbi:MAG: hypothetical protein H6648_04525 [Caldilineae bacterium]|nr:hypothetical protein [Caldilineae bacterium]
MKPCIGSLRPSLHSTTPIVAGLIILGLGLGTPGPGRALAQAPTPGITPGAPPPSAQPGEQATDTPAPPTETLVPPTETLVPASATPVPATVAASVAPSAEPTEPSATAAPSGLPNEERPILVLERFEVEPGAPQPGQTFRLRLQVRNEGEHFAENLRLGLSSATFLPVNQGALGYANDIDEGDSVGIDVDMRVVTDAKSGIYPLAITLRWDDSYGESYSDETTIGISVGEGAAARPLLSVISTRMPARVSPGLPFDLVVELLNSGGREARNAVVVPSAGPLALVGGGPAPVNLAPGANTLLRLRVQAAEAGEPGATAQTLELRYDDPDGEPYTETHNVGLVVTGRDANGPLPMVASYRTRVGDQDNAPLAPGRVFELELQVFNAGLQAARATRLSIGSGGGSAGTGIFGSVGTSNLRFLDAIEPGATKTLTQRMVVDPGAKPGAYLIEVRFDFVDADGKAGSSTEQVSLLISREVLLAINPLEVPTSAVAGMPQRIMVDLVNQGSSTVSVANAVIRGADGISIEPPVTEFVGPLDAGGFFTLQADLLAGEAGAGSVTVSVAYYDDFNEPRELVETFEIAVEAAPEMPVLDADAEAASARSGGSLVTRILKGLLGLGASAPTAPPAAPIPPGMSVPMEGGAMEGGPMDAGAASDMRVEPSAP